MMLLSAPMAALLGGLCVPLLRDRKARNILVFLITLASAGLSCHAALRMEGASLELFSTVNAFSLAFRLDATGKIFLLLMSFLWPLAALYAFEYMRSEENEARFFCFYTLSYGVTQLLALSANLFSLYLFYECLTLVTLPLVTHKEDPDSIWAGETYGKYTIGGAALGLAGLMVLAHFGAGGAFVPGGGLSDASVQGREDYLRAMFLAAFLGFGAKAAVIPLSRWLPRASVAPTPVTALLHAVAVVNAGVFACIRLTYDCFGTALLRGSWAQTAALLLTSATILYGAVQAVRERNLKRRLAWSTVYNLSYMLFSAVLMSPAGLSGALTHLCFHGLIKITLFFCAGAFLVRAGAVYLSDLRGLGKAMPYTVAAFTLSGLALTGVPPLIGFLSKLRILEAAVQVAFWPAWIGAGCVLLSSVLACVYLLEPAVQMIFQKPDVPRAGVSDPTWRMLLPFALLCLCIVLLGFFPDPFWQLIEAAAAVS